MTSQLSGPKYTATALLDTAGSPRPHLKLDLDFLAGKSCSGHLQASASSVDFLYTLGRQDEYVSP